VTPGATEGTTVTSEPIPGTEYVGRVERLRGWLSEHGLDAACVSSPPTIAYLCGLASDPEDVVHRPDDSILARSRIFVARPGERVPFAGRER
jgi:Xaa-Pro aminopeptidase